MLLMGIYNPQIANLDRLATEFDMFGDHTADVAVGNFLNLISIAPSSSRMAPGTVFQEKRQKATLDWSSRFKHGCSQIIDWLLWLENQKNTNSYINDSEVGQIQYTGLLVISRDKFLG